jgi:hypothetical protein
MSLVGRPGQYLSCLQSAHIYRLIDWVPPARRPLARLAPQRSLLAPSPHAQAGSEKKSLACTPACWPASSYPSNQSESRAWSKHAGSQVISLQATNHVDTVSRSELDLIPSGLVRIHEKDLWMDIEGFFVYVGGSSSTTTLYSYPTWKRALNSEAVEGKSVWAAISCMSCAHSPESRLRWHRLPSADLDG